MKVTVNVECSPEEARAFMGLPDVQPMQEALMQELQQRLSANIQAMNPETMISTWLPAGMQGAEQLQKMFWGQVQSTLAGATATAVNAMSSFTERKPKE
jgi:ATP-dependent protease HslVU (ClpYQ) peptidase subunit